MTSNEFMQKVLDAFPEALVESDEFGELIVYTGFRHTPGDFSQVEEMPGQ